MSRGTVDLSLVYAQEATRPKFLANGVAAQPDFIMLVSLHFVSFSVKQCLKMSKSKVWLSCKVLVTIFIIAKMCSAENASSYQYLRLPRQAPLRSKIHNHYPPPAIPPTPQSQLSRFPRPQSPVPWLLFLSLLLKQKHVQEGQF